MKIILLQKVVNLGSLGDIVEVANGYARNYLIPFNFAKRATQKNIEDFKMKKSEYESMQHDILEIAKIKHAKIDGQIFTIQSKSGVDGKLFGSVTALDIVNIVKTMDVDIKKSDVIMPHGTIKHIGEFNLDIVLHHEVKAKIIVNITPET